MRRTGIGNGQKSLERGSTFEKRVTELQRVTPLERARLKRPANAHLAALNRRLAWLFHDSAQGRPCPICRRKDDYMHAHHCVERSFLETELTAVVTPERLLGIVWDLRNALGICEPCHLDHHYSMRPRIGRLHLPDSAWEFAAELDALVGIRKFTVRLEAYPEQVKEVV